jgi:hypothetical protein
VVFASDVSAQQREAPQGMFRDLDDEVVGTAVIVRGKQLFINDGMLEELHGARRVLNQPVKHSRNPLIVADQPSDGFQFGYGSVLFDQDEQLFKMWYAIWRGDPKKPNAGLGYATSRDGISWQKPAVNRAGSDDAEPNNLVFEPRPHRLEAEAVFKDSAEANPERRYKMLYSSDPEGTGKSWCTNAAYSPDGIHWTPEVQNPLIPFSDTQSSPFWDAERRRYVAFLRFGPPNRRLISRVESEDFVYWSPKVTVLKRTKLDEPFATDLYNMAVLPYEGDYLGLIAAYHGETIQPIPQDRLWADRVNLQLAFSRNGVTWRRVGRGGVLSADKLRRDRDWKLAAEQATFLPYGEFQKDWDWGQLYPFQPPLVVGDEIRIYYSGHANRHWGDYHGDTTKSGIGVATLRLDGFVSVEADGEATLTTRPLVFIGDTLVVNANAASGSLLVEALDADGEPIAGFTSKDCVAISTDSVQHIVSWNGSRDCHLLQARPIKLRFHINKAKLYSFEPRVRHKHYLKSYD